MSQIVNEHGVIQLVGVISVLLFVLVFCGAVVLAWRAKRPFLSEMESLPLEDGAGPDNKRGENRHE